MATDLRIEADNTVGQLATLSEELGKVGVNIEGFCATVVDGRGVLHVLVENAGAARQALVGAGYIIAAEREALVLEGVEDRPDTWARWRAGWPTTTSTSRSRTSPPTRGWSSSCPTSPPLARRSSQQIDDLNRRH